MRTIVSFILVTVLLITCSGCFWHEREEHEHGGFEHERGMEHERH